jgi:ethanolamine transporter
MNPRGKIIASAFAASAANLLGAQLGFTYAVSPSMVAPMLLAKLVSGAFALPLCHLLARIIFRNTGL